MSDIEVHDNYFTLTRLFKVIKIDYDGFNVHNITRVKFFALHTNIKAYWVPCTEVNYKNIKLILKKTNSGFTLTQLEDLMKGFSF